MGPAAGAVEVVPPGNRHSEQPDIPGASVRRTKATKSTFDAKYERIRDLIERDSGLRGKIKKAASSYGIDPIHIVGALVGEHTYNVDAYDQLQTYYVKAISYAGESFRFEHAGEAIMDFVARPQFSECDRIKSSYALWSCRENVWNTVFRGKKVDGKSFPDDRFSAVFFQPFYAGQTFGLGQLSPLTALMNSDRVAAVSGASRLQASNAASIYKAIMDPDSSLAYMAADIREAIDAYRTIAGFDISRNPGLTATLYNVGNSVQRARDIARKNRSGDKRLPEENYYGWLINDREAELRAVLAH
nr:DUF1402 family protein [Hoeflea marina]